MKLLFSLLLALVCAVAVYAKVPSAHALSNHNVRAHTQVELRSFLEARDFTVEETPSTEMHFGLQGQRAECRIDIVEADADGSTASMLRGRAEGGSLIYIHAGMVFGPEDVLQIGVSDQIDRVLVDLGLRTHRSLVLGVFVGENCSDDGRLLREIASLR